MVQIGQAHPVDARRVAAFPATPDQPRHVEQEWGVVSHSAQGKARCGAAITRKCDGRQRAFGCSALGNLKIARELLAAADPITIDENLWSSGDLVLGFECIDLLTRGEEMFLKVETGVFEHAFGDQAEGAFMSG
jgi:hypothetical protein